MNREHASFPFNSDYPALVTLKSLTKGSIPLNATTSFASCEENPGLTTGVSTPGHLVLLEKISKLLNGIPGRIKSCEKGGQQTYISSPAFCYSFLSCAVNRGSVKRLLKKP